MSNELLELLKSRRSIRSYLPKMIKEEELDAIVEVPVKSVSATSCISVPTPRW